MSLILHDERYEWYQNGLFGDGLVNKKIDENIFLNIFF